MVCDMQVWDLSAGTLVQDLKGHTDTVYSLCFNRDSSALASGPSLFTLDQVSGPESDKLINIET